MANYRKMYFKLFNRLSKVIGELVEIQQECEDDFINSEDAKILELKKDINSSRDKDKQQSNI